MKNFKLDRKGFTLIELLAVITILGILMLILIPSVSRIIENSRKNTFLSTAKNYANAVRDEWAADNLYCSGGTANVENKLASSLNTGDFYVFIQSDQSDTFKLSSKYTGESDNNAKSNFTQLINSGGRSSWGNNEIVGYVRVNVHEATSSATGTGIPKDKQMIYDYYVELIDSAGHGIVEGSGTKVKVENLIRSNVLSTAATATTKITGSYVCVVA